MMSAKQAAAELGISQRRVLQLIRAGRLPAQRVGWGWVIMSKDLEKVRYRPVGWPKGKPRKRRFVQ